MYLKRENRKMFKEEGGEMVGNRGMTFLDPVRNIGTVTHIYGFV